jgi:hypothetical protein
LPSLRLLRALVYLPFSFCLASLISDMIAPLTAVCADVTGGNSKTATYRLPPSSFRWNHA